MKTMNKILCTLALLTCYFPNNYPILVVGDPNAATGTTFSFNVGFTHFDDKSESSPARWWTATNDPNIGTMPDDTQKYGLSIIVQAASYINPSQSIVAIPMVNQEDATVFSVSGSSVVSSLVPNPLWGGIFSNFDVSNHKPFFTLATTPNLLYSVNNIVHHEAPSTKPNVTELLVYNLGTNQEVQTIRGYNDTVYSAYALGAFTDTNSPNLALHQRVVDPVTKHPFLKLLATLSLTPPLTTSTNALIGGEGQPELTSFGPNVVIDSVLRNLFLGLQATAGTGGVALGLTQIFTIPSTDPVTKVTTYTLSLFQIAPTAVLTAGFDTVISAQNGNSIRITSATGMLTSTNLPYVIVARDNGTGPETIYALPLTPMGTIADYSSVKTIFGTTQPIFANRYFDTNIADASQINPANPDIVNQIQVGGVSTPLPIDAPNTIKKLFVVGDSVYAVIGDQYTTSQLPGTYRSQAIFAPEGYIIGWSPWTRVLGSDQQMNYGFVDYKTLTGLYVASQTQTATPTFNAIYQTTFNATSNLTPFLTAAATLQGIQGLFDFNQTTPGFNNELSLLIATAFNKVTIGQTGANNGTAFGIKTMSDTDVLSFTGTAINDQQALVAAEIAHNGSNHFIFVGGSSGVSVLSDDTTGVSWSGTLANIAGLSEGQTWKTVGDFSSVKKLVWDTTYLYILTSDKLYSILLDPTQFIANPTTPLSANVVISASDLDNSSYLLDLIMDNGYGLLGTTNGLYTLNGTTPSKVTIPQGLPAISKLIAIASSSQPQRSFATLSNLHVLDNTFGTQQARIHRFAIQNNVLSPLPDTFVAQPGSNSVGKPGPFIIFDNYISSYFTDGSWNIATSYFTGVTQPAGFNFTPFVQQITAGVRSGLSSSQVIMKMLATYAPLDFIKTGTNVLGMVRETTSGAVIAAGAFEAHTNA